VDDAKRPALPNWVTSYGFVGYTVQQVTYPFNQAVPINDNGVNKKAKDYGKRNANPFPVYFLEPTLHTCFLIM